MTLDELARAEAVLAPGKLRGRKEEPNMEPVLINDWDGQDAERVLDDFAVPIDKREGVRILFGDYTYECYYGDALVIFKQGDKLFEVHGSHCSCFGLEGQWEPEETTFSDLKERMRRVNHEGPQARALREWLVKHEVDN